MIVWTPAVLGVLYACLLYFCIYLCSAELSMFTWKGALEIRSLLCDFSSSYPAERLVS